MKSSLILFALVLLSNASVQAQEGTTNNFPELRRQIGELARRCCPHPGTPWADVKKVWDNGWPETVRVNTSVVVGERTEACSILVDVKASRRVCLTARITDGGKGGDRVIESTLFVTDVGGALSIAGQNIHIPVPPTEEYYLKDALGWLKALKKAIEEKRQRLGMPLDDAPPGDSEARMLDAMARTPQFDALNQPDQFRILTRPEEIVLNPDVTILCKGKSGRNVKAVVTDASGKMLFQEDMKEIAARIYGLSWRIPDTGGLKSIKVKCFVADDKSMADSIDINIREGSGKPAEPVVRR